MSVGGERPGVAVDYKGGISHVRGSDKPGFLGEMVTEAQEGFQKLAEESRRLIQESRELIKSIKLEDLLMPGGIAIGVGALAALAVYVNKVDVSPKQQVDSPPAIISQSLGGAPDLSEIMGSGRNRRAPVRSAVGKTAVAQNFAE